MSAPTLPPGIKGIERFPSTRVHQCAAPWACEGIGPGSPAAYVGIEGGLVVVCGACASRIEAGESPFPAQGEPAPDVAPVPVEDGPMPSDPYLPELEPGSGPLTAEQLASGEPGEQLCGCNRGADRAGFSNVGTAEAQRWVHNTCGLPAYAGQAPALSDYESAGQAPAAEPNDARPEDEGDDPIDADAEQLEHHECECTRVTKRAKFGRTSDGRPTHEHCGGVLREKHRHLAPQPDSDTESENDTESEAQTDDRDDAAGDPAPGPADGAGPGAGLEAGSAHGPTGAVEGGGEGGEGASGGDRGGDQGGSGSAGAWGIGGDDPQPARGDAVEGVDAGGVADRLEGHEGGPAGRVVVREVREEDRQPAARPGEVALGLADFYSAPATDEPAFSLADFYSAPTEEVADGWGAPVEAPDSDNYLGEFSVAELLAEVARRGELGGTAVGLVIRDGEGVERTRRESW